MPEYLTSPSRLRRWVTYHGLSINITNDLSPYSAIVPCGISDRPVSTVKSLLVEESLTTDPVRGIQDLNEEQLLDEYRVGLLDAFLTAFNMNGVPAESEDMKLSSELLLE